MNLSLRELSQMSGVSIAHLGRIENGQRVASPHSLQKLAKPLGFDLYEILIGAGYLSPDSANSSDEQRGKLNAELNTLLERIDNDSRRIRKIVNRLLMST